MNKICTLTILLLLSIVADGQTKRFNAGGIDMQLSSVDASLNDLFCKEGQNPEFPGGLDSLVAFAKQKIKYPQKAVDDNVQGSVILHFVIDKKGNVIDKQIIKSVRKDIDKVCLSMLSRMPKWKPGRLNDKRIEVNERWKITFVLTD